MEGKGIMGMVILACVIAAAIVIANWASKRFGVV